MVAAALSAIAPGVSAAPGSDSDEDGVPNDVEQQCQRPVVVAALNTLDDAVPGAFGVCTEVSADPSLYPWCLPGSACFQYDPPTMYDKDIEESIVAADPDAIEIVDDDEDGLPSGVILPLVKVRIQIVVGSPDHVSIETIDEDDTFPVPLPLDTCDTDPTCPVPTEVEYESDPFFIYNGAPPTDGPDDDDDGYPATKTFPVTWHHLRVHVQPGQDPEVTLEDGPEGDTGGVNIVPVDPDDGDKNNPRPQLLPDENYDNDEYSNGDEIFGPTYLEALFAVLTAAMDTDTLLANPDAYLSGIRHAAQVASETVNQAGYFLDDRSLADPDGDLFTTGVEDAEGTDASDRQSHPNRAPTILPIADVGVDEGATLTFNVVVRDADGPDEADGVLTLTLSDDGLPDGMTSIDTGNAAPSGETTFTFEWTPGYLAAGEYTITFGASDDGHDDFYRAERFDALAAAADQSVTITVADVNAPPSIVTTTLPNALRAALYDQAIVVDDEDFGDTLKTEAITCSKGGGTAWISVSADCHVTGTPQRADLGPATVTVVATDSAAASVEATFNFVVQNVNVPPVVDPVADRSVIETHTLTFAVTATDEDNDSLECNITAGVPAATVEDCVVTWVTTYDDAGDYVLTVTVSDGAEEVDTDVNIEVVDLNRVADCPALTDGTVDEGDTFLLTVECVDPDGDIVTYDVSGGPDGGDFWIDPDTGEFSWNTLGSDAGEHTFTFTADDGSGDEPASVTLDVTVTDITPPVFDTLDEVTLAEGDSWCQTIGVTDDDGDDLTLTAEGLPDNASFDELTWELCFDPGFEQAGAYVVSFTASDGFNDVDATLSIIVDNTNREPVIDLLPDLDHEETDLVSFVVTASDPDGDAVTMDGSGLPGGATFEDGVFSWQTGYDDEGCYLLSFEATDAGGLPSIPEEMELCIANTNRLPTTSATVSPARDRLVSPRSDGYDVVNAGFTANDDDTDEDATLDLEIDWGDGASTACGTTDPCSGDHVFSTPGTYTVSGIATDVRGDSGTTDWEVRVYAPGGDADADGLTNEQEITGSYNLAHGTAPTDPANPDSDGDGTKDKAEIDAGSDPNRKRSNPCDLDGDGLPNSMDSASRDRNKPVQNGLPFLVGCGSTLKSYVQTGTDGEGDVFLYSDNNENGQFDDGDDHLLEIPTHATIPTPNKEEPVTIVDEDEDNLPSDVIVRIDQTTVSGNGVESTHDEDDDIHTGAIGEDDDTQDKSHSETVITSAGYDEDLDGDGIPGNVTITWSTVTVYTDGTYTIEEDHTDKKQVDNDDNKHVLDDLPGPPESVNVTVVDPNRSGLRPDGDGDGFNASFDIRFLNVTVYPDGTTESAPAYCEPDVECVKSVTIDEYDDDPERPVGSSFTSIPVPTGIRLGEDNDGDGINGTVIVEYTTVTVYRNGDEPDFDTTDGEPQAVDPDDDDPDNPVRSSYTVVILAGIYIGEDADRDNLVANVTLQAYDLTVYRDGSTPTLTRHADDSEDVNRVVDEDDTVNDNPVDQADTDSDWLPDEYEDDVCMFEDGISGNEDGSCNVARDDYTWPANAVPARP